MSILIERGIVASAISASALTEICKKELTFSQNGSFFPAPYAKALVELLASVYPPKTAAVTWRTVLRVKEWPDQLGDIFAITRMHR